MKTKNCIHCSSPVYGRSDKKFCDDICRSGYNNRIRNENVFVKKVNTILVRNRRILEELLPSDQEKVRVKNKMLTDNGFNFFYQTHSQISKSGSVYSFCYEYGYLRINPDSAILVRRTE